MALMNHLKNKKMIGCLLVSILIPLLAVAVFRETIANLIGENSLQAEILGSTILTILLGLLLLIFIYIEILESKNRKKMYQLAYIDQLTGLGNFEKMKLDKKVILKENKKKYILAVVDIDKLKLINEMMSFEYGSEILIVVAQKIRECLMPNEVVYRLGNDLFAILLFSQGEEKDTNRLMGLFDELSDYYIANHKHALTFSCGVYQINETDHDLTRCIDSANIARLAGKSHSHNSCIVFDHAMLNRMREIKEIENEMKQAFEEEQLKIYLQPKYRIQPYNRLEGAEALVRWIHPTKGMIAPDKFVSVLENNGNIPQLDLYIFEQVCKQMRIWLDKGITFVPISINISRITLLGQLNFIEEIEAIAKKYEIDHSLLDLEILESVSFGEQGALTNFLRKIRAHGFKISMDDFGSGYSSLGLLKDMPIDALKLDRSFFADWEKKAMTSREASVVSSILQMAQGLGVATIAEGVEEEYQVNFLRQMGCDLIQGYYFSKPLSVNAFEKLLEKELA